MSCPYSLYGKRIWNVKLVSVQNVGRDLFPYSYRMGNENVPVNVTVPVNVSVPVNVNVPVNVIVPVNVNVPVRLTSSSIVDDVALEETRNPGSLIGMMI